MKKLMILYALFSALFIGCSSDAKDDSSKPGSPVKLIIMLSSNQNKAVGQPSYPNESAIKKGIVFVFRGGSSDPVLDGSATFDFTTTSTPVTVDVTQGPNRLVYVMANIDPADFTTITKLSDLYNVVNKATLAAMRTGVSLAMSGSATVDASTATTTSPAQVTIPLSFVGSRVHIQWNFSGTVTSFTPTGVYLLNVKSESDYFAPAGALLTDNVLYYLYGRSTIAGLTGPLLPVTPATNTFDPGLQLSDLSQNGFDLNYFYVLENNSNYPTMVVIEGQVNGGGTYFYPIIINGPHNGSGAGGTVNAGDRTSTVKRGNIYYVQAFIQGFGTSDPYEPLVTGALEVTITTADWNPIIHIDQVFQ